MPLNDGRWICSRSYPGSNYGSDIPALETKLRALRDDLRAEADDRGWEVD